jgi:hypothetical protein
MNEYVCVIDAMFYVFMIPVSVLEEGDQSMLDAAHNSRDGEALAEVILRLKTDWKQYVTRWSGPLKMSEGSCIKTLYRLPVCALL